MEAAFLRILSPAKLNERKHVFGPKKRGVSGATASGGELPALDELADGGRGGEAQERGHFGGIEEIGELGARGWRRRLVLGPAHCRRVGSEISGESSEERLVRRFPDP